MMKRKKRGFQGNKIRTVTYRSFCTDGRRAGAMPYRDGGNCDCREGTFRGGAGYLLLRNEDGLVKRVVSSVALLQTFPVWENDGTGGEDTSATFFGGADGYLYKLNPSTNRVLKKIQLGTGLTHCVMRERNGKIRNIFASKTWAINAVQGDVYSEILQAEIRGACVAGNRLFFGLKGEKVQYSAPYAPRKLSGNLEEGGLIQLPAGYGEIRSVCADEEKAYAFLSEGIFEITPAASGEDFLVKNIPYAGGEICAGLIAPTGKGILFLSSGGAFRLLGGRVEKVCEHLPIRPNSPSEEGTIGYCDDLVLFDYQQLNEEGALVKKRLVLSADGKYGYFAIGYGKLGGTEYFWEANILFKHTKNIDLATYSIFPNYKTPYLDFGTPHKKYLRKVRIYGKGLLYMNVLWDGGTSSYRIPLENGGAEVRLIERGEKFAFEMSLNARSEVTRIEFDYYCTEG